MNPNPTTAEEANSWTAMATRSINDLLKQPDQVVAQGEGGDCQRQTWTLGLIAIVCLLVYGVLIGAFSGGVQWIAAPVKLLIGTALAALLCFPSLYIFSALGGADRRPAQLLHSLTGALALAGLLLLGFAPVAFVFTFSVQALPFMGAIHLGIGLIAFWFGFRYLERAVLGTSGQSREMMRLWALVFLMTWLQMSTTLRPILGESEALLTTEKQFFLVHWLETLRNSMPALY